MTTFLHRFPLYQTETIKQYWRHIEVVSVAGIFLLQSIEAFKNANILFVIKLN